MSTALEAFTALRDAMGTVPAVQVFALDDVIRPPGVVVEPPVLTPRTGCPGFNDASFTVQLVVAMADAERVIESLLTLVNDVLEAIEGETPAAVTTAAPGTYTSGGTELPAYQLTVEYPL